METFTGLENAAVGGESHLAIGMFDGVHLGHQSVIATARLSANRCRGHAGVLTFRPHPSEIFRPDDPTPLIMPPSMKAAVLGKLSLDFHIEQPFDHAYAATPAEEFLSSLRQRLPGLKAVYVGENWRFGHGRKGDIRLLVREGSKLGVNVVSVPRIHHNGQPISSTRIRESLAAGDLNTANTLLGYTYFSEGEVRPGRKLGRDLGFPTLNLTWSPGLKPAFGVYAVLVRRRGETTFRPGVANYGVRPTVDKTPAEPLLEIHLLDPAGEETAAPFPFGEGDRLSAEWHGFLRTERKFPDLDSLRRQIERDREAALDFFRNKG